jgi:hypothetical protein
MPSGIEIDIINLSKILTIWAAMNNRNVVRKAASVGHELGLRNQESLWFSCSTETHDLQELVD